MIIKHIIGRVSRSSLTKIGIFGLTSLSLTFAPLSADRTFREIGEDLEKKQIRAAEHPTKENINSFIEAQDEAIKKADAFSKEYIRIQQQRKAQ